MCTITQCDDTKFCVGTLAKQLVAACIDILATAPEPAPARPIQLGDLVKVAKAGKQAGNLAIVLDPDWTGRVKVTMETGNHVGQIKSYLPEELELSELGS